MNKKTLGAILLILTGLLYFALPVAKSLNPSSPSAAAATETSKNKATPVKVPTEQTLALPLGVPILMYHKIGDELNNDAVISKERFNEHMAYLDQQGYHPISLDELYGYVSQKKLLPSKPVVLTFDDGYRDTYEIAFPILKKYGFKSVLFISAAGSGDRLSWQELQEMKASGMEVSSHSYNHRDLDGLSAQIQTEEINKSKEIFDQMLNQDTRYFCYPNGSYNQTTLNLLQEKGIVLAVTTQPGWAKPGDNPLTLRRIWMGNSVDLQHLAERLTREDYSII